MFGIALLKMQVSQATRIAHLFGERKWCWCEVEAYDFTTRLCECCSHVAGASCDIQDACPWLGANCLHESCKTICILEKRICGVCLRLLSEFLAHHCFVI